MASLVFQIMHKAMKRFLTIVLSIFLAFTFTACGGNGQDNKPDSPQTPVEDSNGGGDSSNDGSGGGDIELPEDKFD